MGRKNCKILVAAFLFAFLFTSCKKEKDDPKITLPANATQKVFIVCEGSLGNGNGSLGFYRPDVDSFYEDIFKAVNDQSLGDVFHSIQLIGNKYFLCINNSDKIIAINKADLKIAGNISIPKPRYILPISAEKAYVSTIFSNKIYIINPQTLQVTSSFSMPAQNPEGMVLWNDKAIINTWDTALNKFFLVDINTNTITKEIIIGGRAPQEALFDKEGMLWILSGNVAKGKSSVLTKIDPVNWQIIQTYNFPLAADVIRPVFNNTKDSLYFIEVNYNGATINNGIYRMSVYDNDLPQQPFIAAKQFQYFWALGIEPSTGNIYIGDPKGFVQKGEVFVYKPSGSLVTQFKTGVGPGHFYFE